MSMLFFVSIFSDEEGAVFHLPSCFFFSFFIDVSPFAELYLQCFFSIDISPFAEVQFFFYWYIIPDDSAVAQKWTDVQLQFSLEPHQWVSVSTHSLHKAEIQLQCRPAFTHTHTHTHTDTDTHTRTHTHTQTKQRNESLHVLTTCNLLSCQRNRV